MNSIPMKMLMFIPSLLDPTYLVRAVVSKRKIKHRNASSATSATAGNRKNLAAAKPNSDTNSNANSDPMNTSKSHSTNTTMDDEDSASVNFNVISSSQALRSYRVNQFNNRPSSPFFETSPINSPFFDNSSYTSDELNEDVGEEEEEDEEDDCSIIDTPTRHRHTGSYTYDINGNIQDDYDDVWSYNPETGHTVIVNEDGSNNKKKLKSVRFT